MFGILHWKSGNGNQKEAIFIEKPPGSSNPETNSACNRCRVRKVKCSINNGLTCDRCEFLRKQCNFGVKKYRGGQYRGKASTNITELEYAEMLWLNSNKLPLQSLSPSENSPENRDEAQIFSDELAREHASVGSKQNILVDELGQSLSDQDRDDVFNFSSLSSPNSPIVPLDSAYSTAAPPLDDSLAWVTYTEDEIPQTLPSTTQSRDSSLFDLFNLFDTSFGTTLMSLETSTADLATVPCHDISRQSSCLAVSVLAVEDFEARSFYNNRAQLDSILASQKEAIQRCHSMVKCTSCMAKRENLVVLVFMTEKIVEACRRIVVLYGSQNPDSTLPCLDSSTSTVPEFLPQNDILLHNDYDQSQATATSSSPKMNLEDTCSVTATRSMTQPNWRRLLVGDYEISSSLEWEYLVGLLIFLQLKALLQLVADIKDTGSTMLGETQVAGLRQAERRINELEKKLSAQ